MLNETTGRSGQAALWEEGREWLALVGIIVAAAALWAAAELANRVWNDDAHGFDKWLLLALRAPGDPASPIGPAWLQEAVRDLTALGSNGVLAIVTFAAAGYLLVTGSPRAAAVFIASVAAGLLVNALLKIGFDRPRPELVAHGARVFTSSFPSSHATMSAIVYLTLGALLARTQPAPAVKAYILSIALLLSLLVGASRVYLGVHWPTDVLAGWAIGAAWALASWAALVLLQSSRPSDAP